MIYTGTGIAEFIQVNDDGEIFGIELVKMPDEPTFIVCSDYDDDWSYEFTLENNSDYERVKFNIMDAIFECNTMDELIGYLSNVFEDGFADILVYNDDCDCDGNCENCNCNE